MDKKEILHNDEGGTVCCCCFRKWQARSIKEKRIHSRLKITFKETFVNELASFLYLFYIY